MATTNARANNRETSLARRTQDYRLASAARPRSLVGQFFAVLLQPRDYFLALPQVQSGVQWVWMALLILVLAGVAAVRQASLADGGSAAELPIDTGFDPSLEGGFPADGGGAFSPDVGFPGGEFAPPDTSSGGSSGNTSSDWTTAVVAASGFLLIWGVQAFLLSEVSLFKGRAPALGQNLRIAIWSSVPLALMLILQLLFYAAGGQVGQPGIAGLLQSWDGYATQPPIVQALLLSLASRVTIFWLWSLVLLYFGARYALRGRWWSSVLVVVLWVAFVVIVPVATGRVTAPETETSLPVEEDFPPSDFEDDQGFEVLPGDLPFPPVDKPGSEAEAEAEGETFAEGVPSEADGSGEQVAPASRP